MVVKGEGGPIDALLNPRNHQEKLGRSTKEDVMAVTGHRTTPATPTPNASAPAGPDTSDQARGEPQQQRQASGAPGSIRQRLSGWLWSLEGPRKVVINGLLVIVSLLGSGVVLKDALKQVAVIDTISVPKDLEADGYTPDDGAAHHRCGHTNQPRRGHGQADRHLYPVGGRSVRPGIG